MRVGILISLCVSDSNILFLQSESPSGLINNLSNTKHYKQKDYKQKTDKFRDKYNVCNCITWMSPSSKPRLQLERKQCADRLLHKVGHTRSFPL